MPLAHRVWVTDGARNRGTDDATGLEVDVRLSLASEARDCLVVAMLCGY